MWDENSFSTDSFSTFSWLFDSFTDVRAFVGTVFIFGFVSTISVAPKNEVVYAVSEPSAQVEHLFGQIEEVFAFDESGEQTEAVVQVTQEPLKTAVEVVYVVES